MAFSALLLQTIRQVGAHIITRAERFLQPLAAVLLQVLAIQQREALRLRAEEFLDGGNFFKIEFYKFPSRTLLREGFFCIFLKKLLNDKKCKITLLEI